MTGILSQLRRATSDLLELDAHWALIGALAASVHTEPRTTRDIDVAVAMPSSEEFEELLAALEERGYRKRQLLMHGDPILRLGIRLHIPTTEGSSIPLDLLTSSCGIEREIVETAESVDVFPDMTVPVASRAHVRLRKKIKDFFA